MQKERFEPMVVTGKQILDLLMSANIHPVDSIRTLQSLSVAIAHTGMTKAEFLAMVEDFYEHVALNWERAEQEVNDGIRRT